MAQRAKKPVTMLNNIIPKKEAKTNLKNCFIYKVSNQYLHAKIYIIDVNSKLLMILNNFVGIMKRIILAIDSFKGCLSSLEAEEAAEHGLNERWQG